jgi:biopolymer transport protein ExbD
MKSERLQRFKFIDGITLNPSDMEIGLFNVLNMIALFSIIVLLNSRFVLSPGFEISLPYTEALEATETTGVVTVQSENFIMFNGNICSLNTLEQAIKQHMAKSNIKSFADQTMLIRQDKSISVETLIKICDIAKKFDYSHINIAASTLPGY